jgi:hypothetical protein
MELMSNANTRAATIRVEVRERIDTSGSTPLDRLDDGATAISGGTTSLSKVIDLDADELSRDLETVTHAVTNAMGHATVDAWAVELSIGFKAGVKVPVLMSGEANAAIKVTLSWKKPS